MQETGGNIIGILPGIHWASGEDRPTIVAAHWDIESESEEDGRGLASILEIVRVLMIDPSFR